MKILPPLFGLIALIALFFKLPAVANFFDLIACSSCAAKTPFIVLIGAAYFSAFISVTLCFRFWPRPIFRYGGFIWALSLSIVLIYLSHNVCYLCLTAHISHLCMWIFWKPKQKKSEELIGLKLSVGFACALAGVAFFSTMNFNFLAYELRQQNFEATAQTLPFFDPIASTSMSTSSQGSRR